MAAALLGPIDGIGVLGAGCAFPARTLDNLDVLRALPPEARGRRGDRPVDEEELRFMAEGARESLGLWRRAWAHQPGAPFDHAKEETTLDLAVRAGRAALEDAGIAAGDLSLILCATSTPPRMTSTISAGVGHALSARAACMDTRTGCSGGLFALATGALFAQAGAGPVLIIGTETFSKVIPPASRLAQLSLGDGAGALVLGKKAGARILSAFLESDGALGKLISTDGALPPTASEIERGGYVLSGAPDELLAVIPGKYEAAIAQALARAQLGPDAIDLYVPHQTSATLIAEVCKRAGIDRARAFVNVEHHANIGSAGWLVALCEARASGRCRDGDAVLLAAVGGGMSWAAAVLRW